jgi:hypothetical protein
MVLASLIYVAMVIWVVCAAAKENPAEGWAVDGVAPTGRLGQPIQLDNFSSLSASAPRKTRA